MITRRHPILLHAAGIASTALLLLGTPAMARAQRGIPHTAFTRSDFSKLTWLEGSWQGSAPGERTYYERYHVVNDSTIEISYFSDSTMSRVVGHGRIYLSAGGIYHTFGSGTWAATRADETGVYFIPRLNAHNTFAWSVESPDSWTATLRSGVGGHDRVTVFQVRRARKR